MNDHQDSLTEWENRDRTVDHMLRFCITFGRLPMLSFPRHIIMDYTWAGIGDPSNKQNSICC